MGFGSPSHTTQADLGAYCVAGATLFFATFAIVAIGAILVTYHRQKNMTLIMAAAFALALGGAIGNLLDRLRFGYVVDFFDAKIIHWPVFNVADSAISIAMCLLIFYFLRSAKEEGANVTPPSQAEQKPQE